MSNSVREPTVWLLQESWSHNVDMSSAQRYGKVVPLLSGKDHPSQAPGPAIFKIKQALLKDYLPGDYVVYALSDPASAFLAGMVFAREGLDRAPINWLSWNREKALDGSRTGAGFYTPSTIEYR